MSVIGLIIGAISGTIQFWLLSKFTKAITGGAFEIKYMLFGILQFFIPLIVLLGCALVIRRELMWVGIGMAAALLGGGFARFFINASKKKNTK